MGSLTRQGQENLSGQAQIQIIKTYFYPECVQSQVVQRQHRERQLYSRTIPIQDDQGNKLSEDGNERSSFIYQAQPGGSEGVLAYGELETQNTGQLQKNQVVDDDKYQTRQPLIRITSIKEDSLMRRASMQDFEESELGASLRCSRNSHKQTPLKNPFNYKILRHLRLILACRELDADVREFRVREYTIRRRWMHEKAMIKDIKRTRYLGDLVQLHEDAKRVIEFYCAKLNVSYCQGMLEVVLPFLCMKQGSSGGGGGGGGFDLASVYAHFKRFVYCFIPNNLHTKFNGRSAVLPYLKCCLNLTDMVLQYVDRELHNHLVSKGIFVEMTALASWVMTLFTRVADLALVYEIWEIFLFERDKYFIFYFAVSLLRYHRQRLLRLRCFEKILPAMAAITIPNYAALAAIYRGAIQVRQHVPASFELTVARYGIFEYNPIISNEELILIEAVQRRETLPIMAEELLHGSTEALFACKDNNSKHLNSAIFHLESEQQVYIAPNSCSSSSCSAESQSKLRTVKDLAHKNADPPTAKKFSFELEVVKNRQQKQQYQEVHLIAPLTEITLMKLQHSSDLRVSSQVRFALLDLRLDKRPRLAEAVPAHLPVIEVDLKKQATLATFKPYLHLHFVFVGTGDLWSGHELALTQEWPGKPTEVAEYNRLVVLFGGKPHLGTLQGGAAALFNADFLKCFQSTKWLKQKF